MYVYMYVVVLLVTICCCGLRCVVSVLVALMAPHTSPVCGWRRVALAASTNQCALMAAEDAVERDKLLV
jgi:hypothetical protein